MFKHLSLPLAFAALFTFASCDKKDDDPVDKTDYSIESTEYFELISQHDNGWVKEGRKFDYDGKVLREYEYYDNGNIKWAKVYKTYPSYQPHFEVSRSEDNKPLWSKYYDNEGELWFEIKYEGGLLKEKKVYSEEGVAYHNYLNGELSSIDFNSVDNKKFAKVEYNANTQSRKVIAYLNLEKVLEQELPYMEQPGAGAYMHTDVPVGNPFTQLTPNSYTIREAFSSSINWEHRLKPAEWIKPLRYHDDYYYPGYEHPIKYAVSTDVMRNIIEQYPFEENGVMVGGGYYKDNYKAFSSTIEVRSNLREEYEANPELYILKYGDEYAEKVYYGYEYILIGAARNIPTNSVAAEKVKEAIKKYVYNIQNGSSSLSEADKNLLDKVWVELKFFSTVPAHKQGVVVSSHEQLESLIEELTSAEDEVIQVAFRKVEYL